MNEGSKNEAREYFSKDVRRLQPVALHCGMTTGIRLRLREVLGHSSHSTLDYYGRHAVRDTLSAQVEQPGGHPPRPLASLSGFAGKDGASTRQNHWLFRPSVIRHMAAQQRFL